MPATLAALRSAFPAEGLFAEKDFLLSPEPLRLDAKTVDELEKLGHRLQLFQRGCNELYHRSLNGKAPAWSPTIAIAASQPSCSNSLGKNNSAPTSLNAENERTHGQKRNQKIKKQVCPSAPK